MLYKQLYKYTSYQIFRNAVLVFTKSCYNNSHAEAAVSALISLIKFNIMEVFFHLFTLFGRFLILLTLHTKQTLFCSVFFGFLVSYIYISFHRFFIVMNVFLRPYSITAWSIIISNYPLHCRYIP